MWSPLCREVQELPGPPRTSAQPRSEAQASLSPLGAGARAPRVLWCSESGDPHCTRSRTGASPRPTSHKMGGKGVEIGQRCFVAFRRFRAGVPDLPEVTKLCAAAASPEVWVGDWTPGDGLGAFTAAAGPARGLPSPHPVP